MSVVFYVQTWVAESPDLEMFASADIYKRVSREKESATRRD